MYIHTHVYMSEIELFEVRIIQNIIFHKISINLYVRKTDVRLG